jgi:hypothetical protein
MLSGSLHKDWGGLAQRVHGRCRPPFVRFPVSYAGRPFTATETLGSFLNVLWRWAVLQTSATTSAYRPAAARGLLSSGVAYAAGER